MRTFDFTIEVKFFDGREAKVAVLRNFTYPEAFSVFNDLKLKYACDAFPFHEIVMYFDKIITKTGDYKHTYQCVVNYLCNEFFDFDDSPAF